MDDSSPERRPSRVRRAAAGAAAVALAAVTLGTIAAGLGALHWRLDLFSSFRIQYAAAALLLVPAALLLRRRTVFVLLALAVAALNVARVWPWLPPAPDRPAVEGPSLRIASWNTWRRNDDADGVLRFVRSSGADVVALQETTEAVRARLPDLAPEWAATIAGDDAVLIRAGLAGASAHETWLAQVRGIEVRAPLGDGFVTIVATHLPAPFHERYATARAEALAAFAERVTDRGAGLVLIGDLNTTPWSREFQDFVGRTGLVDSLRGRGPAPTWPFHDALTPILGIPVDHCLTTPDLAVTERWPGPAGASNHRPIHVRIRRLAKEK